MSQPFLAEIKMFGGNFAPRGYANCDGQVLSIAQNTALFSLLGTSYGGNGTSNFALPNLQGSVPMHSGNGLGLTPRTIGEQGGEESVTLTQNDSPAHSHTFQGLQAAATTNAALNNLLAVNRDLNPFTAPSAQNVTSLAPTALSVAGSGQPHNNMQPYQVVTFIIAMNGVYPARN